MRRSLCWVSRRRHSVWSGKHMSNWQGLTNQRNLLLPSSGKKGKSYVRENSNLTYCLSPISLTTHCLYIQIPPNQETLPAYQSPVLHTQLNSPASLPYTRTSFFAFGISFLKTEASSSSETSIHMYFTWRRNSRLTVFNMATSVTLCTVRRHKLFLLVIH